MKRCDHRNELAQASARSAVLAAQYACTSLDGDRAVSPITGKDTVASLRARLEQTERQAHARQRQLERYAADLREVFKQERARAQELRRSYIATVRALSNAVEARDAYTGKHAERVAAYGMELARSCGDRRSRTRRRSSSASCCTTSARSPCPTRSCSRPAR